MLDRGEIMVNRRLQDDVPSLTDQEYNAFSNFLKEASGIHLGDNKQYLVTTRIRKLMADNRLDSIGQLIQRIQLDSERGLRQQVINAMTTNETFWFRDTYPFDYLSKTLIPEVSQTNRGKVKIWCAACSSGQEPYSVSMVFEELLGRGGRFSDADILATDVSTNILDSAKAARYDKLSLVRGLSQERTNKFFQQVDGEQWEVQSNIRQRVRFRTLNLQDSFYLLGKFDIVFCRNVLIYFTLDLKREILTKIHGTLNPGGTLFLGSSEGIADLKDHFEMIHCNPGVAYRAKPL